MSKKTIKIGNIFVEVPDDSYLGNSQSIDHITPTKKDLPPEDEAPILSERVYSPAVMHEQVDRWEALGNIKKVDKPWVKNGFLIVFMFLPFAIFELLAIGSLIDEKDHYKGFKFFLMFNVFGLFFLLLALNTWNKARKA